ncbi:hypothetical protein OK349_15835 [Sphingomonas sp. BT-65]|uniref:hypothetical protein n=1 Tax=Sphingomonas sp. BT-65 TaxID=2989821 RepID=UPI002235E094|nr:hypothetical protein [Sphingomonas sp. BT-65]MCW4463183.1 hypothetical protein [Sphingomonas sp. BT-65]
MSCWLDAGTQLERALARSAEAEGIALTILVADWTSWASATFTGARHRMTITAAASPLLDRWLAALPEAEFRLRGHLVADLAVAGEQRIGTQAEVELEALTVEDC